MTTCGHHVRHADALPSFAPAPFQLMRRNRAAPEKIRFKSWHAYPLFVDNSKRITTTRQLYRIDITLLACFISKFSGCVLPIFRMFGHIPDSAG
jgi:hypothetical protein